MTIYSGDDNILDSRDLEKRIVDLEDEKESEGDDFEEGDELSALLSLKDEAGGEWHYGQAFIADFYFEDYARELAEDIGAIDPNAAWPLSFIDWEAAADALKADYTSSEYFGTTYYYR